MCSTFLHHRFRVLLPMDTGMTRRSTLMAACALALLAVLALAPAAGATARVGVVGPNVLVRPADAPTTAATAHLVAAGNEFESTQVVVRADGAPLSGVDVLVVGTLTGPGGATIPAHAFTVYRVGYYDVAGLPSDGDLGGALGLFPDALIPKVDTVWHEARRAFPIDVPAGQNRLAWVDVLVPPGTPAGTYAGASIRVTAAGGVRRDVPLELEVVGVDLPSTTSLDGGFDVNPNRICQAHDCGAYPGGSTALTAAYERVALDNRLTLAKPPTATPSGPADGAYRTYTRPLLLGTGDTRLAGARLRTITIYQWAVDSADEWRRIAEADGLVDRVRFHCDEIARSASAWSACRSDWQRANALWRGAGSGTVHDLPLQVTTSIDDVAWARANGFADLADRIAVLIPVINYVHPKSTPAFPGRRAQFAHWTSGTTPGGVTRQLWTYTSCMSMGCSPAGPDREEVWRGWPGYGVDQPAAEARALGWIAWRYDLAGEYYYETARDLPSAWTDLWSADGGNHGDGTLFYPGTTARIGGSHDVPIESIRLKRIRDGREDHEWLLAAERTAGRARVDAIAAEAFPDAFHSAATQAAIDGARDKLAGLLGSRTIREITPNPAAPTPARPRPRPRRVTCAGRRATIMNTARGETLRGTRRADVIAGLGGNDRIIGFGRGDFICAGAGNDVIITSSDRSARDIVACGTGRDRIVHDRRDRVLPGCERRTRRR
jgi:hypothetical protein